MGGPSYSSAANVAAARLEAANTATNEQIKKAKELHSWHFSGNNDPVIFAAILQALSTNYAAIVSTSER